MRKVLTQKFFERDTIVVARELLGKYLVRRLRGKETALMITEAEAYDGFYDRASHAHRGQTARNIPMFGEAGVWYVYLVYGMYEMLNVVTDAHGYPAAVLIRGADEVSGPGRLTKALKITRAQNGKRAIKENGLWIEDRGVIVRDTQIKDPRGKAPRYCRSSLRSHIREAEPRGIYLYFVFTRTLCTRVPACVYTQSGSFTRSSLAEIKKTPRIGVDYAGVWAKKKYRFVLKN